MGIKMEIVDPRAYEGWDDIVAEMDGCTPFHTAAWARVLADSYGYEPMYFLNDDPANRAVLPLMEVRSALTGRRGVSLPFTDAAPALGRSPKGIRGLAEAAIEQGRKRRWKSVQLRGGEPFGSETKPSTTYLTHTLDLSAEEDQLFKNLSSSTRRAIRKAEGSGIEISVRCDGAAMQSFCRLNALTRREHGLPPQPPSFFNNIQRHMLDKKMGFIVLAHLKNQPIATAMFFVDGTPDRPQASHPVDPVNPVEKSNAGTNRIANAIFKYGASDKRYQSTRANNLVMWYGILACKRAGCRTLDLGRTRQQNEGLLRYKRGWGTEETTIQYFRYDLRRDRFNETRMPLTGRYHALFRVMPLFLLRGIGAALYRHMG